MTYIGMAPCLVMAYIVMACTALAYIVMAHVVMARSYYKTFPQHHGCYALLNDDTGEGVRGQYKGPTHGQQMYTCLRACLLTVWAITIQA